MKIVLSTFNSKYIHSALGLYSIASFCKTKENGLKVLEHTLQTPLLSALSSIYKEQPAVVGIAVYIWNRQIALALANMVKQVLPKTKVVLGGPEVSYDVQDTFVECPQVDFILQGEGEEVFNNFLIELQKGNSGRGVAGLAWQEDDGTVNLENGVQVVEDLAVLKFSYLNEVISKELLANRILYYESTRGCPFTCAYCLSGVSHNVRYRPVEIVLQELQQLIDCKVKQVKFVDRTYNLNKQHYLPIMRWLAKQDTETNFHFEIKADTLDEEVIDFLCSVPKGRFQLEIGIQSVHEKTLSASGRIQDWVKLANAIERITKADNMHMHLDLICGLPYEGVAEFRESLNKVYALQPQMLQIGFLKLLKGSTLRKDVAKHGYVFIQQPPYEVLSNKYIDYGQLRELKVLEDVFEHTYNSGKFFNMLNYMVEQAYSNDAYEFYSKLSNWWEREGLTEANHNIRTITEKLLQFVMENHREVYEQVADCLKLDILLYHEKTYRPEYLSWQSTEKGSLAENFWRDEVLVQKYIVDYSFSSWRNIRSKYHLEQFNSYFPSELKVPVQVLFDLEKRSYLIVQVVDFI